MIKIIDGLLDQNELKALQDLLLGHDFPWFFNSRTVAGGEKVLNDFQLIHAFYVDSDNFGFIHSDRFKVIEPLLAKIGSKILIRAKANMRTVSARQNTNVNYHTDDMSKKFEFAYGLTETAILYVNTNNGYTEFKDHQKVDCLANRLVTFPTNTKHRGVGSTDTKQRVVINFNYIKDA